SFDYFVDDMRAPENDCPEFVFIEPSYLGDNSDDWHPPHDIRRGDTLIATVYDAIRRNGELWNSSLLVVVCDEHGGYYDHVSPGPAIAPDDDDDEFDFLRLGVRVPAILISPWVDKQV